jgi:putative transposase
MKAADVTETVEMALAASGLSGSRHRPRLLSDNGSSYVAGDLATWLGKQGIKHVRGAPNHPMTQGKIERWHQTMKNRILLENYFLPGDIEASASSSRSRAPRSIARRRVRPLRTSNSCG